MLKATASSFGPAPTAPADWAVTEFGRSQLGDARRTERLLMIATAFAQQPTATLPQACGPGPATQGAYRFFENDDIDPAARRQSHHQATLERARHQPPRSAQRLSPVGSLTEEFYLTPFWRTLMPLRLIVRHHAQRQHMPQEPARRLRGFIEKKLSSRDGPECVFRTEAPVPY